ncbi:ABC transporter permease [soil metagenome]
MSFFTVVLRDLLRRPVRTALTMLGIAIGIAAVVMLVGIAWGFEKSWSDGFEAHQTDIVVANLAGGVMPKAFGAEVEARVAELPHVAETTALLAELMGVEDVPMIMVSGRAWGGFTWKSLTVVEGRLPADGSEEAVVLGRLAAETLGKKVGDPLQIEASEFTVVGIVDGGAVVENGAIFISLSLLQEAMASEGQVNFVNVRLAPGTTEAELEELTAAIEERFPEGKAMVAGEVLATSQGVQVVRAMSWSTSLLAVLVGVLGVMNTMLMTVFERTHEIGVLLALGWKRTRIVRMVLMESALLGFFGGIAGVLLGVLGLQLLRMAPAVRGLLEPDVSLGLVLVSVGIALVVGVVSGLYPAWRSSRLSPSLALHG